MRRRVFLLLLCLLLVSGCWSRRELETLGFVLAVGIDWNEQEDLYELTAQMARPQALGPGGEEGNVGGGGGQSPPFLLFTTQGATIFEAVRNLATVGPRRAWWGHNQMIVLGDALARQGITPVLDFFVRDGETRRLVWLLVTPGTASEILSHPAQSEAMGSLTLLKTIRNRGATSTSGAVRLHDFKQMLGAPMSATAGLVSMANQAAGPSADYLLQGTSVFTKQHLNGYLDGTETRGMLWIRGEVVSGILIVPCPGEPEENVGLEIISARSQIHPRLEQGRPAITVNITAEAHLGDKGCLKRLSTPQLFAQLDQAFAAAIRRETQAALERSREMRADLFGFGTRIHQELPAAWWRVERHWEEDHFPSLPVSIKIKAHLRREGLQSGTSIPR